MKSCFRPLKKNKTSLDSGKNFLVYDLEAKKEGKN